MLQIDTLSINPHCWKLLDWSQLRLGSKILKTRMHSSRMRTGRSVTVFREGASFRGRGGGGCASFPVGASLLGGCFLPRGGGVLPSPPLVNRITHTSKNIILATTSLRPVTRKLCQERNIFTPLCQFTSQNSNSRPTSKMKSGGSVPGQRHFWTAWAVNYMYCMLMHVDPLYVFISCMLTDTCMHHTGKLYPI